MDSSSDQSSEAPAGRPCCADVEAARRLIRQMNTDDGRHNSTVDVSPQAPGYTVPEESERESYGRAERERLEREWVTVASTVGPIQRLRGRQRPLTIAAMRERLRGMAPPSGWVPNPAWVAATWDTMGVPLEEIAMRARLSSVLGRFKNGFVRSLLTECNVGDASLQEPNDSVVGGDPSWRFKRCEMRVTPDNGRTWHDEVFWERVS
jgi:hypothetical protein